jgi:hypothetical protein
MADDISRLLQNGSETILRQWTEKVASDKRIVSDAKLSYVQLIDHVPQILEELRFALGKEPSSNLTLQEGREHGRQRWQQGFQLKEIVRELTLLRATLFEFIDAYRGALPTHTPEQISLSYRKINGFMDEELYKTVEAYLDSPQEANAG